MVLADDPSPNLQNGFLQVTRKRTQRLLPEDEDGYLRYLVYTIEKVIRAMEDDIDQWVWILDLKGICPCLVKYCGDCVMCDRLQIWKLP